MKTNSITAPIPPESTSRWARPAACGCLVAATALAYGNSFAGPFVFDDYAAIVANSSIRHLWPLSDVLSPPHAEGVTVGGRPVVNLTLALNYAISGERVWSYHVLNLLIHLAGGLVLFGLVRRTLAGGRLCARFGSVATELSLAIAALWALHPLQTESVTYVVQRAESLAGFFQLLTLYAFVRGAESASTWRWLALSVGACALGMATKEVMVVAPLLVLLYDRTFVAGTWGAAWRERRNFYIALAATWLPLAWLVLGNSGRGGTAGFGLGVSGWNYAFTQCQAIGHYLSLALWPHPLVFDYGTDVVRSAADVAPAAALLIALLGLTGWALLRRPVAGFIGAWFFLLLSPSSSFVPVASQPVAEHRLYLPLAAVVALLVGGSYGWLGRRSIWLWCAVASLWGARTWSRNETYRSELTLWSDTVEHCPTNARAHSNLANALLAAGRATEAATHYEEALRLAPDYADAENNFGRALTQLDRGAEALPHFEAARRAKPDSVEVLTNLGSALLRAGRAREAIATYERALQLAPPAPGARYNLANAQVQLGEFSAAVAGYEEVLRVQPDFIDARFNLAATLLRLDRAADAIACYEELLRRAPSDAAAHAELANILAHVDRGPEAVAHYETALRLQPDFPAARAELDRLRRASKAGGVKP